MDQIRRILANVQKQLGRLSVTQKLLIASLCVLVLMTLFLVSQYAGSPTTVALLPAGTGDDQQKAAAFLSAKNIKYTLGSDGKVMLVPEQKYIALAAMTKEQAIPGDKKLLFDGLVANTSWIEDLATKQVKQNIALQNELARVIRAIPGIEDASVFISRPANDAVGLGPSKKAVAQVAVFPTSGQGLDQPTVNALADLVAGSVSGLDVRDVAVIDAKARRSYRAASQDDLSMGGSYIEQVAKVEKRLQDKLAEHLRFIPDVIVSVNAIVDAARRESVETKFLPKGDGTVAIPTEETTTTETNKSSTKPGAEPGLGSNVTMDINRAGGASGSDSNTESTTTKTTAQFGQRTTKERDATGKPTKINVTISVPREYVAAIAKQKKGSSGAAGGAGGGAGNAPGTAGSGDPSDADIASAFDSDVKPQLESMISPLVETEGMGGSAGTAAAQLVAGTVKAFLIPVSMASMGGSGGSGGGIGMPGSKPGFGGGSGIGSYISMIDGGLIKTGLLGLLALVSLGLMFSMVRKAGKATPLPSAEELVGIPPALEPGTDVVGEAVEGDTAMVGIEIDDESLKTGKMLEEIGDLVKSNPSAAASVFNRWLSEEE